MSDEQQTQTPPTEDSTGAQTAPNGGEGKRPTLTELIAQHGLQDAYEASLRDRLARQAAQFKAQQDKAAEEAKAAALAEQGEFKALYEAEAKKVAELAAEVAKRDRAALLRRVARAAGLDPDDEDLVSRLRGDDEEALLADAKKLAARLAPATPPAPPNLNGGGPKTPPAADPEQRRRELEQRYPALKRRA